MAGLVGEFEYSFENDTGEECVVSGESGESSRFRRGEGVLTLPSMLLLFLLNRSFGEQNADDMPVFRVIKSYAYFDSSVSCGFGVERSGDGRPLRIPYQKPSNIRRSRKGQICDLFGIGRPAPGPTNNC